VRQLDSRSQRASRLGLDLLASKLRRPPVQPGTVRRPFLIERLRGGDRPPIVSVVAPPGYGKTTLLAQWAERNGQSFAWVSVDEADNDPKVLLSYVAEALDAVEPIGERVFDALASPGSSVPGSVVPRLGSAFSSMTSPVALVLDDVHLLRNLECRSALSVLADHVPPGSRLALAGRTAPPLRIARLRAEGKLLEIGPEDLSLTPEEASSLLHNARLALGTYEVAELHRRTEGWPVALYLAALCLREGSSFERAAVSFGGDDLLMSDYVESEFFARISRQQRAFLTRTAVLERMCGSLCDATLELRDSAATLADLARSNLLLVPLDRRGAWYRYHHLFRDMLLAELRRREPDLIPVLHRRAAQWCENNGAPGEALEHRMKVGDTDAAADLAGVLAFPAYQHGRVATVERWFGWLEDRGAMETHPPVAVMAAMLAAMTGKPAEAERWTRIAERAEAAVSLPDGSPTTEPWLALLRALLCRNGPDQMRADAELAAKTMAARSFFQAAATLYLATAHLMVGDRDQADMLFEDQVAQGRVVGGMIGPCVALAERALLAIGQGAWEQAGRYLSQARSVAREAHLEEYPPVALMHAAAAQVALHQGDLATVRAELTCAQRLRPHLTYALPHLAVQVRIELARCHLALLDRAAVRTLLHEADEILRRRPHLGVFVRQAKDLRTELSQAKGNSAPGASALTAAELRLLPLLGTHMSLPEIAEAIFLSRNTIRSQAYSIYRKLDVSSRNQAVTQAKRLGLLDR
jgi:LuxR family transcriptional regulator, maltose regulon positive regulatory protein